MESITQSGEGVWFLPLVMLLIQQEYILCWNASLPIILRNSIVLTCWYWPHFKDTPHITSNEQYLKKYLQYMNQCKKNLSAFLKIKKPPFSITWFSFKKKTIKKLKISKMVPISILNLTSLPVIKMKSCWKHNLFLNCLQTCDYIRIEGKIEASM